ncbi:MAG: hypothetical protein WKG00_30670 [Polyangiaceae bacterium]
MPALPRRSTGPRSPGKASRRVALAALAGAVAWTFVADPGFAGGSVEEQRARLPPPATCVDPVEGIWVGHNFEPRWAQWYIFTLEVKRPDKEAPALEGKIFSHYWDGTEKDVNPPPCRPGMRQSKVSMPAKGDFQEGRIAFGGTSWTTDQSICGGFASYNPDRFTGAIDPATQEFQSVNNDGGRAINVPTVFRRVKCFDSAAPPKPALSVDPPPFAPPSRSRGCSKD